MSNVFRPLVERRTYRDLIYLLSGVPLAAAWFALLLAGWLTVGLLSVTPLRWATWLAAEAEAAVARGLLGVEVRVLPPAGGARGYRGRTRAGLADPTFWAQQLYLVLRMTLGFAIGVGVAAFVGGSALLVALPATYSFVNEYDVFGVYVHTLGTALAYVPAGLAGIVVAAWLVRWLAGLWGRLARILLAQPLVPSGPSTAMQALLRRALPAHAAFYAGLNAILIVIWAVTTRAYFWPEWTLIPFAIPLAIHAWTVVVDRSDFRRYARTRALAIDFGASLTLFLFFVAVWAVTARAYFWPMWPGFSLAVIVVVHALTTMGDRINVLTTTRAGAVDAAESERRRIERDLHDGALAQPFVPSAPSTARQERLRRALPAHAAFYAGLNAILIVIWAVTTRAYFWPEWTLMPLAIPLTVHAWTVFVDSGDFRRIARTRALAIDLGAVTSLFLFFVGIWAVTTRAYFWPMWPAIGLAVVVGLHALSTMTRRIDVLTTTRAGAVDAAESELRRIERDLHDGAQARLVALGMSLGLAEQKFESDPHAARQLLAEARAGAGEALRDLRDLARGIHPPILADRGLEAALAALAARVPLIVELRVDLPERPPEAVESAAYFVAAEALANASKHAIASRVDIRAARMGDAVVVTVMDDGRGGADPGGAGLQGLRGRVEALDGTFRVESPPGGPTILEAVLPCAS
jgi:signal transduction histidine kinase